MKLTRIAQGAAVAGAAAALSFSAAAGADTQRQARLHKDGSVWLVRADGHVCKIYASRNLTPSTCLNASLVRVANHGFTAGVGGKVNARLYYNQSWQNHGRSAYACISPQSVWTKRPGGVTVHFDQVNSSNTRGTGLNKPIWHDVARVLWTSAPCV